MPRTDRAEELRDWYAEDNPDGAELLDDIETFTVNDTEDNRPP